MKWFVLAVSLFLCCPTASQAEMVSIAGEIVSMRSGPGDNYEVVWELGKGYPLQVLDQRDEWLEVTDYANDGGWVKQNQVSDKAYMVVKAKIANIRSGPGENYRLVRQAWQGVVFRTLEIKESWVKVRHEEENVTGWVLKSLLWGW